MIFKQFKIGGVTYLAIPRQRDVPFEQSTVRIVSQAGHNFGGFMSIDNFKAMAANGEIQTLGTCALSVQVLS